MAGVLVAILAEEGWGTAVARARASRPSRATAPGLILLDALLPDFDGAAVWRRLQADPASARAPIVFLTGTPTALAGGRLDGCAHRGVLRKPVDLDGLLAAVARHLAG